MKLKLTDKELIFDIDGSIIKLPSGTYNIRLNPKAGIKENWPCEILDEKGPAVLTMVGFLGMTLCGDAIVTCIEMGYDLAEKEDLKKIKKQDKEKIKVRYNDLLIEQPELFDRNNIDYSGNIKTEDIKTEDIKTEDIKTEDIKIEDIVKKALDLDMDARFKRIDQTETDCNFCPLWHPKVSRELVELSDDWNYNCSGDQIDKFTRSSKKENSVKYSTSYDMIIMPKGFFKGAKTLYASLCNNCHSIISWKHNGDPYKITYDFNWATSYKGYDECTKVSEYPELAHDIFNKPDNIIELIVSKIERIPDAINDEEERYKEYEKQKEEACNDIIDLLKNKGTKITTTDIATMLKRKDADNFFYSLENIKELCKDLFNDGKIDFAGNNRYFISNESKSSPIESKNESKSVDIKKELKKFKDLLDEGLIEKDDYNAKKSELLGL